MDHIIFQIKGFNNIQNNNVKIKYKIILEITAFPNINPVNDHGVKILFDI